MTASLFETLERVLPQYLEAPLWAVGLSGGSDSTALLHLVRQWCRSQSVTPPLRALHVDHSLNPQSSQWQSHCQQICDDWDVPLVSKQVVVQPRASVEAAAREARYGFFESALPPGAVLFLAHHLDDQVETFFQRLLRGAGVDGLAAMPASRALGEATVVRPLLAHTREELSRYVAAQGLAFVEDPSNAEATIDRNFLRLQVLPLIESRWPAYRRTVARAAQHMASSSEALRQQIGQPATVLGTLGDPGLGLDCLQAADGAQSLRLWLKEQGLPMPDASALEEFVRQLCAVGDDSAATLSARDYQLVRYGDAVYRLPDLGKAPSERREILPGQQLTIAGVGSVELAPASGSGWALEPGEVLFIDWRRGGERVREAGREGSRDLKAVFQERRVPPWWRDRVPLLYAKDQLLSVAELVTCPSDRWRERPRADETLWQLVWRRDD